MKIPKKVIKACILGAEKATTKNPKWNVDGKIVKRNGSENIIEWDCKRVLRKHKQHNNI